jgi:putative transposase
LPNSRVACRTRPRNRPPAPNPSTRQRSPAELISLGGWSSGRFCLSARAVEALRAARGVGLTDAAIRCRCRKVGPPSAHQLRRRHPSPGEAWPLEDGWLSRKGERPSLWRAVAQDGNPLDRLGPRRRDQHAAKTFFRTRRTGRPAVPRVLITGQLARAGAATRELLPGVERRQPRSPKNRAGPSPQPTRPRERRLPGGQAPGHAQPSRAASGPLAAHVRPRRHRCAAPDYRPQMTPPFQTWQASTGPSMAA